jgi:Uma2 family endonuclease
MATAASRRIPPVIDYPSADGLPMAETPLHRQNLTDQIAMLSDWFAGEPQVYVSGNMFVYYVRGNRNKHVAPDVFVVRGVPKDKLRKTYRIWEEGKGLDAVIELTSQSTREEDEEDKYILYRDELKVPEYFLFDPYGEYLVPPLKGYRLTRRKYVPIQPVAGRLPSEVLGLHLAANGPVLRLYNPAANRWLLTPAERIAEAEAAKEHAEAEIRRLRSELEALRRRLGEKA